MQSESDKVERYVPSIQERMREQSHAMSDFIEQAFDDFIENRIADFKKIEITKQLKFLGCKQPHARLLIKHYQPLLDEYKQLLSAPSGGTLSEDERDQMQQLKEGYSHLDRKQIKQLHDFLILIGSACEGIIAESKANRKPRKLSMKSPEQVVKKIKYRISDEKHGITSISPDRLVGANCLVVFNSKTRKLGIYYTSIEDPLGTGREGSGLYVKGTTLTRFDEEKSVCCTLRKPMDQLQEVKSLTTRKKFENWFEKLTTTPVKMNGRINSETVLIATY